MCLLCRGLPYVTKYGVFFFSLQKDNLIELYGKEEASLKSSIRQVDDMEQIGGIVMRSLDKQRDHIRVRPLVFFTFLFPPKVLGVRSVFRVTFCWHSSERGRSLGQRHVLPWPLEQSHSNHHLSRRDWPHYFLGGCNHDMYCSFDIIYLFHSKVTYFRWMIHLFLLFGLQSKYVLLAMSLLPRTLDLRFILP